MTSEWRGNIEATVCRLQKSHLANETQLAVRKLLLTGDRICTKTNDDCNVATTVGPSDVHCFVHLRASALRCRCFKCVDTNSRNTQCFNRQFFSLAYSSDYYAATNKHLSHAVKRVGWRHSMQISERTWSLLRKTHVR